MGLLRCVEAKESSRIAEEIHVRIYGPYINGFILAKRILRLGYIWLTMETDSIRYVQKCQTHTDMICVTPNELHVTN